MWGFNSKRNDRSLCDKDHLFLNYDGDNDYSRKVVLGAGSKGSVITGGAYTYCAVRGDQMTSYVTSVLGSYVPTSRTVNGHALSSNVTVSKSDVGLGSVVNTGDSDTPVLGGTTKFTTGGAYTLKTELENAIPTKLSDLTNDVVNNGTLTVQANGTSKGTFSANQSGNTTINITASDLGVSSAMIFGGVALQTLSEGGTQNAGATSGNYTASTQPTNGTVYLDKAQHLEYVWIGGSGTTTLGKWELLGQDGSLCIKFCNCNRNGCFIRWWKLNCK